MFKKIFYNTGAQIAAKVITASSTLALTVLIGRSLGPAGYGDFVKIFTFVGYFYIFTDFGLNQTYIKLSQKADSHSLINYLAGLRVFLAIALALSAIMISTFLPFDPSLRTGFSHEVKLGIIIASLTILTQAVLTAFNSFFQLKLRYDLSAIAAIIGTLTTLAVTVFVLLTSPSLNLFVSSYVLGAVVVASVAWLLIVFKLKTKIKPAFSLTKSRLLIRASWPIGVALVMNMIYFRSDVFVLTYTRPPQEVGIYGLAYQFFEATLAIPLFFSNSLYPFLVKIHAQNINEYKVLTVKWFKIFLSVSILITLGLIIVSFIIPLLFTKFYGTQTALIILALGLPFFFITAYLWHLAIIKNLQKTLIPVYFFGGTANVLLNLIFIPQYGYVAAATITVISEALITILLIIVVSKKKGHDLANQSSIN